MLNDQTWNKRVLNQIKSLEKKKTEVAKNKRNWKFI